VQFSFMRIDEQARKFYFEHQFNNLLYLLRAALFLTVHAQFLLNDNMADRWRSPRPWGFDNHSKRTVQFN